MQKRQPPVLTFIACKRAIPAEGGKILKNMLYEKCGHFSLKRARNVQKRQPPVLTFNACKRAIPAEGGKI